MTNMTEPGSSLNDQVKVDIEYRPGSMPPTLTYHITKRIGSGGYSTVFRATEVNSGQQVALKKSRVSQRVKRPVHQYESRVLQLLQGHPAIPALYGYGQLPHFEYLSMELLGPTIKECAEGPVCVETTARVVLQMLSALEHVHQHGFVHRDVKPENILCSATNPASTILIDFGISRRIKPGEPARYDPVAESKNIVGTLNWASLNSLNGIDLSPRDDLESLAYTAFFLLNGDLPWRNQDRRESHISAKQRIRAAKAAESGDTLGAGHPPQFGYLLDYSRLLRYDQLPDYEGLRRRFADLQKGVDPYKPLDWSTVGTSKIYAHPTAPSSTDESASNTEAEGDEEESFSESYFEPDIADWDHRQSANRDRSLTLPAEQVQLVEGNIPRIVEVTSEKYSDLLNDSE